MRRFIAFVILESIDDNNMKKRIGDDKQTVCCLFVLLTHNDDDELVYVRVYLCVCARALVLRFSSSFSRFETERR
jgi:hypothetical protein